MYKSQLKNILKNTSRSIYLSIKMMPRDARELFAVGYLLCRAADTITDTSPIAPDEKLSVIKKFPQMVEKPDENRDFINKLTREIPPDDNSEQVLIKALPDILKTLSDFTAEEKKLINFVVCKVCKGMETDLTYFDQSEGIKAFETGNQLENYCYHIGGAPGVFWAKSFLLKKNFTGEDAKKFITSATEIGKALQITNILRDVSRDIRNARCYLPAEDLKKVNLTCKDLLNTASLKALQPVIKKWINRAAEKLSSAEKFILLIPKKDFLFKASTILPIYLCIDTLREIYKSGELLKPNTKIKVRRNLVYLNILKILPALFNNTYFKRDLRLRLKALSSME